MSHGRRSARVGGERGDRGATSLLVVVCLSLLMVVGSALGVVAAMVRAQRSAEAAADLAALAAAASHQRGGAACVQAERIAAANAALLESCAVEGDDVRVVVMVHGPRWLGQSGDLRGSARAGPASR